LGVKVTNGGAISTWLDVGSFHGEETVKPADKGGKEVAREWVIVDIRRGTSIEEEKAYERH